MKCWGYDAYSIVGDGPLLGGITPAPVLGISGAAQIALGRFHSCVLLDDQRVRCWGYNMSNRLGDGTTTDSETPVTVLF